MFAKKRKSKNANSARPGEPLRTPRPKPSCAFCDNKTTPTYTDTAALKKFISDRAKIVARGRSGLCSHHQRQVATEIKHARHLSLMPFIARV